MATKSKSDSLRVKSSKGLRSKVVVALPFPVLELRIANHTPFTVVCPCCSKPLELMIRCDGAPPRGGMWISVASPLLGEPFGRRFTKAARTRTAMME